MGGINHSLGKVYPMSELANTPGSPFDALEGVDGRWSARDLQALMGYSRWENMAPAINRAKISAKNQGLEVEEHFLGSQENPSDLDGRPRKDYHLSPRLVRG